MDKAFTPMPSDKPSHFPNYFWVILGACLGAALLIIYSGSFTFIAPFFLVIMLGRLGQIFQHAYDLEWNHEYIVLKHRYRDKAEFHSLKGVEKVIFSLAPDKSPYEWLFRFDEQKPREVLKWRKGIVAEQWDNMQALADFLKDKGIEVVFETGASTQPSLQQTPRAYRIIGAVLIGMLFPSSFVLFDWGMSYKEDEYQEILEKGAKYAVGYTTGLGSNNHGYYPVKYHFYTERGGVIKSSSSQSVAKSESGYWLIENGDSSKVNPSGGIYLVIYAEENAGVNGILLQKPLSISDTVSIREEPVDLSVWYDED